MAVLPLFVDLGRGPVVLAGGGNAAGAKLAILRARGAIVHWYPLGAGTERSDVPDGPQISIRDGEPSARDLDGAVAAIVAAGGEAAERIAAIARKLRVPVNVIDRPELSTFQFPAIVDRGEVVVAIGTGGASPVLARRLREKIEGILPRGLVDLAQFLGRWRKRLRASGLGGERALWERFLDGPLASRVLDGQPGEAEAWFAAMERRGVSQNPPLGRVTLVGAGPGDPDLLTLKALHALSDADVIFFDELVTPEILGRARRDATRISVGKRNGRPGAHQDDIHAAMIAAAKDGARVVRLKGGDPFIFGRGGEEVEALRAAGIPVSVIPGVTAALGCTAEAEIPLTFRNEATQVVFMTAHRTDEDGAVDWQSLIDPQATLAIYMGLRSAAEIRDRLIEAGRDPATPVAVLARGTRADSCAFAGVLDELPELARRAGDGPAVLVVGSVVAHSRIWRRRASAARCCTLEPA